MVTEQTHYRWQREYTRMRIGKVIESKKLELASLFLDRICGAMPQSTM